METHSSILAWRIPWTRSLVGCSPLDHRESDTADTTEYKLNGSIQNFQPEDSEGESWAHSLAFQCPLSCLLLLHADAHHVSSPS